MVDEVVSYFNYMWLKNCFVFVFSIDITYADLISTIPFENSVDTIELRGDHLLEALEFSVASEWKEPEFSSINMLQVSGIGYILHTLHTWCTVHIDDVLIYYSDRVYRCSIHVPITLRRLTKLPVVEQFFIIFS